MTRMIHSIWRGCANVEQGRFSLMILHEAGFSFLLGAVSAGPETRTVSRGFAVSIALAFRPGGVQGKPATIVAYVTLVVEATDEGILRWLR